MSQQAYGLHAIAYGNGTFVAIGVSGAILTSPDGATWTSRSSGSTKYLNGIAYGNGTFVAVGGSGTILTSPDGAAWTDQSLGILQDLSGISYGNGTFVVIGYSGEIFTSSDGAVWINRSNGINYQLNGIAYGNGTFVAVAIDGSIIYSPDGVEWTETRLGAFQDIRGITFGNGTFVAVGGEGTILTSPDGSTWTARSSGIIEHLSSVVYGNGTFVAIGVEGTILTSPDGSTWTARSSGTTQQLSSVAYGNGTFVVIGYTGTILTSTDGSSWSTRNSYINKYLVSLAYGNETFVAIGMNGEIMVSPDGTTWEERSVGTNGTQLQEIAYGNGTFVAVGLGEAIITSPDGKTWTVRSTGKFQDLIGITYGNGTFVAIGYAGTILTSPDGATWTARSSGTTQDLSGVAYGNGIFVAIGYDGTSLTSLDGVTWTFRNSGATPYLWGLAYGNGTFVAVGDSGKVITSLDGIAWTVRSSGTIQGLYGIAYGGGSFVAVGVKGTILTSTDGLEWITRSSGTSEVLYGVSFGNSTFVAVGENSTILQSDPVQQLPSQGSITGAILYNGVGLWNVNITLEGASSGITTTSAEGSYSFTGLADGSYTITPSLDGYTFSPSSINVVISGNIASYQNFIASTLYQPPSIELSIKTLGNGRVTSYPPGIDCGIDCTEAYPKGKTVVLYAVPDKGSVFKGWTSELCTGLGNCLVTLEAPSTVTALFASTTRTANNLPEVLGALDIKRAIISSNIFHIPFKDDVSILKLGNNLTINVDLTKGRPLDSSTIPITSPKQYKANSEITDGFTFYLPEDLTDNVVCMRFNDGNLDFTNVCSTDDKIKKQAPDAVLALKNLAETLATNENYKNNFPNGPEDITYNQFQTHVAIGTQITHRLIDFDQVLDKNIKPFLDNQKYSKSENLGDSRNRTPLLLIHGWQGGSGPSVSDTSSEPSFLRDPAQLALMENSELVYWQNFLNFYLASEQLQKKYHVYLYRYPTYKHITYNAEILKALLDEVKINKPNSELNNVGMVIVAHSMGGLVARSLIEEHKAFGENLGTLGKLVTLDTPHHGSPLSHNTYMPELAQYAKDLNTQGAADLNWDNFDQKYSNTSINENNTFRWNSSAINTQAFDKYYWDLFCPAGVTCKGTFNPWLSQLNQEFQKNPIYSGKYMFYVAWNVSNSKLYKNYLYEFNSIPSLNFVDNSLLKYDFSTASLGGQGYAGGGAEPVASAFFTRDTSTSSFYPLNRERLLTTSNDQCAIYADGMYTPVIKKSSGADHPYLVPYRVFWDYDHSKIYEGAYASTLWDKYVSQGEYVNNKKGTDSDTSFLNVGKTNGREKYVGCALKLVGKSELTFNVKYANPLLNEPVFLLLENDLMCL